ncbi:MAG: hypothetical protein U5R06_24835 [candidate division KSB1 bacterium]|nr:hypothetical protein [candidate division KSB1 bacterium]
MAVLGLAAAVFGEGEPALVGVARLAEIAATGARRLSKVDVGRQVDRVGEQQVAQEGVLHRLALEVVDDVLAHVAGADAVIDRIVEPFVLAQHPGERRLARPGHAEDGDGLGRPLAEILARGEAHVQSVPSPCQCPGRQSRPDGGRSLERLRKSRSAPKAAIVAPANRGYTGANRKNRQSGESMRVPTEFKYHPSEYEYQPSDDEPFMNERQKEYFRRKLLDCGLVMCFYAFLRYGNHLKI